MIHENEKLWFVLKRSWTLFPFVLGFFLYVIYICQYDLWEYIWNKDKYVVVEAEIIKLDMTKDKGGRGTNYTFYSEVEVLNKAEQTYVLFRDTRDYIGRKIKVAVSTNESGNACRLEWRRPRDEKREILWSCRVILVLLIVGKVLSYFKLKKVYQRIDSSFEEEVIRKRAEIEKINKTERRAIVKQVKRGVNDNLTMEITQICCRLLKSDEVIKSPKMLGHTFLREGDYINFDEDSPDVNKCINWYKYMV